MTVPPRGIGAVYGGSAPHHRALTVAKYARFVDRTIYLPELAGADLSDLQALVVPERLHRGLLERSRPLLRAMLERGGCVVVFGEQAVYDAQPDGWLPGIRFEHRPTNYWWWLDPDAPSGVHAASPGHGLFRHLTMGDATWHHHGVFRPPDGAEVVVASDDGAAVLYVDRVSTPGTLVVTSLDPMSHFGSYFMPATERFLDGFWPWLAEGVAAPILVRSDPMTTGTIEVTELGTRLAFSYDDLLRYHGPANPGGVAHAFKVLERALPLLSPDDPPERREIEVATSFAGPGGRDGFELVTRAVSDQRYVVDLGMERPERGETLMRYVFRLAYRSRSVTLVIREGYVTDEFITLARKSDLTADEADRLTILKQEMADRLLAKPAAEVYDVA